MTQTRRVFSASQWEDKVGYARAVVANGFVFVAGTTSTDPATGAILHVGDMEQQVRQTFANIDRALAQCESSLSHVVRVTMYTTDLSRFEAIGRVHREFFGAVRPAATIVEVARLAHPHLLFEAEVTAVAPRSG